VNIYLDLTREFNRGRLRCIISSGQAVVLHRLAIMSKDGDWIIREDVEATQHTLRVLAEHGARYRFGAPLDVRWLAGGWSAHFEFRHGALRVRTDFVSRPPRLASAELNRLWEQPPAGWPVLPPPQLAQIKQTNREKDYVVIGELARLMNDPADQFLHSRSAADLLTLAVQHPGLVSRLIPQRPLLAVISQGRDALEPALDAERRQLIRLNAQRLQRYARAAEAWAAAWPDVERQTARLDLCAAHQFLVSRAEDTLPFSPAVE